MYPTERQGHHRDIQETFTYEVWECPDCSAKIMSEGQKTDAAASLANKIREEGSRDFVEEAKKGIADYQSRGLMIPREYLQKDPVDTFRDIENHEFGHIYLSEVSGEVRIGFEDYHDGMYRSLSQNQEIDLLALLLRRANEKVAM